MSKVSKFQQFALTSTTQKSIIGGGIWKDIRSELKRFKGSDISMWMTGPDLSIDEDGNTTESDFTTIGFSVGDSNFAFAVPNERVDKISLKLQKYLG